MSDFDTPISEQIWDMKYRFKSNGKAKSDITVGDTWRRIANALADGEKVSERAAARHRFFDVLDKGHFVPAGRIIAGAGTGRRVTLSNCFTMGTIPDDLGGIFDMLKEAALTMQQGGGIGYDFSTIRPKGAPVKGVDSDASGPLSFMDVWDAMCRTIMSAGSRRGAMMATMRCDHPDIEDFITAKKDPARLRMFNVSVLVTDAFMEAVENDQDWPLKHEVAPSGESEQHEDGRWVYRVVRARDLWDTIMASTYAQAEPGVIFIDRVNDDHNLNYLESIATTNPCGEKPMGPYASCLLGSINLARLVLKPFTKMASLDEEALARTVVTAIRMMDNVIEVGGFPLEAQAKKARDDRQLGLGVTGLADMLVMLGIRYGTTEAMALTEQVMSIIAVTAYQASADLAVEKGPFPTFDKTKFFGTKEKPTFAGRKIAGRLRTQIEATGIRNALLVSIAPTGTISLFSGNVSSGIEPIFALSYTRKVLQPDGSRTEERVVDYAVREYEARFGRSEPLPDYFVTTADLSPMDHVRMQAAAQVWVDSSISKTVNLPEDISFEDFKEVYLEAFRYGCKGCTTYRPNEITGSVLSADTPEKEEQPAPNAASADLHLVDRNGETLAHLDAIDAHLEEHDGHRSVVAVVSDLEGLGRHYQTRTDAEPEKPLDRDEALPGQTYKLKFGPDDHALYITINDLIENGVRRPYEVFVNSKNVEHFAWTVALTRMISAVFRRPHDSRFVVEELKAVFDPRGGRWMKGKFIQSDIAAIGDVIERHMRAIGYWDDPRPVMVVDDVQEELDFSEFESFNPDNEATKPYGPVCPKCFSQMKIENGCSTCLGCGNSKCG